GGVWPCVGEAREDLVARMGVDLEPRGRAEHALVLGRRPRLMLQQLGPRDDRTTARRFGLYMRLARGPAGASQWVGVEVDRFGRMGLRCGPPVGRRAGETGSPVGATLGNHLREAVSGRVRRKSGGLGAKRPCQWLAFLAH